MIQKAHAKGYVETLGGRRRRLGRDLNSTNIYDVYRAERQAVNAIVQGTAAEICKDAMIAVHDLLPRPRCQMLVQVHDELVCSVPSGESDDWLPQVEQAMGNGTVMMDIPLKVSGKTALTWYEAK